MTRLFSVILLAGTLLGQPVDPRVLVDGTPEEAIHALRSILRDDHKAAVPHLWTRFERLWDNNSRTDAEKLLMSAILDALIHLDDEGDGSQLAKAYVSDYCVVKAIAYAARRPKRRWPLILEHLKTGTDRRWHVAWELGWEHHRRALVLWVLGHRSIPVIVDVRNPDQEPRDANDIHGAIGLGGGSEDEPIPLAEPFVPAHVYTIYPFSRFRKSLVDVPSANPKWSIVRQSVRGTHEVESTNSIFDQLSRSRRGEIQIHVGDRADRELDRLLGLDDGLYALRYSVDWITWSDADGLRRDVDAIKQRRRAAWRNIAARCVEKGWIEELDVAGVEPNVTVRLEDQRPEPPEPLPDIK
jgi:hypothetical protein